MFIPCNLCLKFCSVLTQSSLLSKPRRLVVTLEIRFAAARADWENLVAFYLAPSAGLACVRHGPMVKQGSAGAMARCIGRCWSNTNCCVHRNRQEKGTWKLRPEKSGRGISQGLSRDCPVVAHHVNFVWLLLFFLFELRVHLPESLKSLTQGGVLIVLRHQ
jgi:hypothetical protein